jgi:type IV secretion system protein VirB1
MTGIELALLLHACAPQVHPQTIAAIISVESKGWPWTLHDNTTDKSYYLADYGTAVRVGESLVGSGHSVDLGIAQINSTNLPGYHLSVSQVLVPCTNIRTGASILTNAYQGARAHFGPWADQHPQSTVRYAISAYNTGSLFAGAPYVAKVVEAAYSIRQIPTFQYPLLSAAPTSFQAMSSVQPHKRVSLPSQVTQKRRDMVIDMMPVVVFEPKKVK